MKLNRDWLWDRKISIQRARAILKNPQDAHFLSLSAILLARKNTPKEVMKQYLSPLLFLENWNKIKRQMRKDSWNNPRIIFWQAIYDKLREKYKNKGAFIQKEAAKAGPENELCKLVAEKIKAIRKQKKLTQSELAKRLKISQQMISRIEKGRDNISLITLKNIVDRMGAHLYLEIK